MKKIGTILTAAVMLFTTSAFATETENVSTSVKEGFKKDFISAANVAWEKVGDFYFADFVVSGKSMSAAYNENGELVATSQIVSTSELPVDISTAIKQKFSGYKIAYTAEKISYDNVDSYYLTVENEKQTLKLKCNSIGISIEKKTKK